MNPALQIIEQARASGIELSANGDNLHYKAQPGTLTLDLKRGLKEHKAAIILILSLPEPARPGEEVEQLRREIGRLAHIAPYHRPDDLPAAATKGNGYHPSKPAPEHYCYWCEDHAVPGAMWQWDRTAKGWVCSNFMQHDSRKRVVTSTCQEGKSA